MDGYVDMDNQAVCWREGGASTGAEPRGILSLLNPRLSAAKVFYFAPSPPSQKKDSLHLLLRGDGISVHPPTQLLC